MQWGIGTERIPGIAAPVKRPLSFLDWKAAALLVFAIWLFVVGAHHEPWFDESQAWLLARDSSLFQLLADRVRYEGTPGLWHLLLWLLIRIGLPFDHLYVVSAVCALAGAALLLWKSPFPTPLRLLLVASYFFAYQFSIVARSYALDLVLIPALAYKFARRTDRPVIYGALVGLLANSNAHSFILAGILGAEWLFALIRMQRIGHAWRGLVVAFALGFLALLVAWPAADNAFRNPGFRAWPVLASLIFIGEAFADRLTFWSSSEPLILERIYAAIVSLLLLLPSFLLFLRAGTLPLVLATIGGLTGFSVLIYAMPWHSGILFLSWIFSLWIAWPALQASPALKRAVLITSTVVATVQATEATRAGLWDIHHIYSGSAQAARIIAGFRAKHPQARIAAAGFQAIEVQPYFPGNIFSNFHEGASQPSFVKWQRNDGRLFSPLSEAYAAIAEKYDLLLMSPLGVDPDSLAKLREAAAENGYRDAITCPGNRNWKGYTGRSDTETLIVFK